MKHSRRFTLTALAAGALALEARAQSALVTHGTVVAANGDQAPGSPGGCLLDGAGTFDLGGIDDAGNVFFRSRLTGTSVTATNERAYFVGSNRSNLSLVIRAGTAVPTLFGGETLNTATGTGLGSSIRISSTGQMLWLGTFSGGASTSANDTAIFSGTTGNFVIAAREGSGQPGTVGATFPNLSALTQQGTQQQSGNRIAFTCSTTGGDTTTANNAAWFGGVPGALEMIMRKGFTTPAGNEVAAIGAQLVYNASGQAVHEETFSTLPSAQLPATTASDKVLFVYTPGVTPGTGTNTQLLREGDFAAGTASAKIGLTNVNTSPFSFGGSSWNGTGKLCVSCSLMPGVGDAVAGVNDGILYVAQLANPVVVLRKGDLAPGLTGETIGVISGASTALNDNDRVAFQAQLTGGAATSANDTAIWCGTVGSLQLVARESDTAPGTSGATIADLAGLELSLTNTDHLAFTVTLAGGDVVGATNNQMLYTWEPGSGLTAIVRRGDVIETAPGVFKTVSSWSGVPYSNGDSRALSFNHSGTMVLRVTFTDTTFAVMTVTAPKALGTAFCSGDGSASACPCGNFGVAGHGCANSSFATGARLTAFGVPSVTPAADSLTLTASSIGGPGLFFQGSAQFGGGAGIAFGDGLLCAGGTIIRLGVVFPSAGAATYPGGLTPAPIHVGGMTAAGDVRHYQCWYRDAAAFCTIATYNLTQGLTISWIP